jgi:hypothetical protein
MSRLHEDQQRILAELPLHPAWAVLRGVVKDKMEREFNTLAKELLHGKHPTDIEWRRGFFAGMKFLLDKPAAEARDWQRQLDRSEVRD